VGATPTTHGRKLKLGAALVVVIVAVGLGPLQAAGKLIERTTSVTVPVDTGPGGTASATARCPEGKRVVLGGFMVPLGATDVYSTRLKLAGERGWRAGAVNYDADETSRLTSIAYCSRLKEVKVRERTVTIPKQGPNDSPATVAAKCHRGERLAFGGFDYDQGPVPGESSDAYLSEMRRTGRRAWQVGAFNFTGSAKLTAIAYCSKHAPATTAAQKTVTLGPSGTAKLEPRCARDERLSFGGYKADVTFSDAFVILHGLERVSGRTLQVSALNNSSQDAGDLTAYAYCARR
jgi:hypothetical protein